MSVSLGSVGGDADMLDQIIDQQQETADLLHETRMTLKKVMKSVVLLQSKVVQLEATVSVMRDERAAVLSPVPSGLFRTVSSWSQPQPQSVACDCDRLIEGSDGIFRNE